MLRIGYRMPLGLMTRPAARIVRELPPSLRIPCTLFFHALRFKSYYRVEYGWVAEMKKASYNCPVVVPQ